MRKLRPHYTIPFMCHMVNVSPSGYYAWASRHPSRHAQEEARLEIEIKAAHKRTRGTFGPERLQRDLAAHGVKAGICRIRKIRKKLGIRCKQVKKLKATTNSKHTLPVADNLLEQKFRQKPLIQSGSVTSRTSLPMKAGSTVLCINLFSGEIAGYAYCSTTPHGEFPGDDEK
nr:IS3 family transposase [Syntrophorhabdus aromaticivorans]